MGLKHFLRKMKSLYVSVKEIENNWFIFLEIIIYGLLIGGFIFCYNLITN